MMTEQQRQPSIDSKPEPRGEERTVSLYENIYKLSVFQSSASNVESENMKLLVTPNKLATCNTAVWHEELIGDTTSGRHGVHSGKYSILLKDGAFIDNTARQKTNLQ